MEIVVRAIDEPGADRDQTLQSAYRIVVSPPIFVMGDPALWQRFLWLRKLATVLKAQFDQPESTKASNGGFLRKADRPKDEQTGAKKAELRCNQCWRAPLKLNQI